MRLIVMSAALVGLVIGAGAARAERWDSKGWVKLGEREVNGRVDHDRIEVGRYEGKFGKLTLYVESSDLELLDFEITFGNKQRFHPEVRCRAAGDRQARARRSRRRPRRRPAQGRASRSRGAGRAR